MEAIQVILAILCGISLFLYGMSLMGDGLKKVAGNKLESLLYKLTNTPLKGVLLGTAVTAVIQSSSATSVMVVGFVNSGMMKVAQGIGIIMGANIGTSITGWILCLSSVEGGSGIAALLSTATIYSVVAIIGVIFKTFMRKPIYKNIGDIMMGFAILMVGMKLMSEAVSGLKESEAFVGILTKFNNPFIAILVGIIFTAILQSASASVGIIQSLSVTGALTFGASLPLVMGIGIGASAPVLLSSIGTSKNGKRTALVYLINDLLGMIIWATIFYSANWLYGIYNGVDGFGFMDMKMSAVSIALMNSVYRMLTIVALFPFIKKIEKLVFWLIKESPEDNEEPADFGLLEERFLNYPDIAISQCHTAMNGMAVEARKNILASMDLMEIYTDEAFKKIQDRENILDKYEDKLGTYLMQISAKSLDSSQMRESSKLLHTISDFERIGDHASGISKVAKELYDKNTRFSDDATYELRVVENADKEIVELTVEAFEKDNLEIAKKIEPLRQVVRVLCTELKSRHINRMQKGKCDMEHGFAFNDMLNNLERIAAHCSNVAVALIELQNMEIDSHNYLKSLRKDKNGDFTKDFEEYSQKYLLEKYENVKESEEALTD